MKGRGLVLLICVIGLATVPGNPLWGLPQTDTETILPEPPARPWESIDVAILLDTSGSMKPLIDAARLKLWEIVQDLTVLDPTPTLRVALLTYGNRDHDYKTGWVKVETDLTENLDLVSELLFELKTGPGGEYVARAVQMASEQLSWTPSEDALKIIFIAGNEPADQDPKVDFKEVSDQARRDGIFVAAIFCGQDKDPHAESWRVLAEWAQGRFATIDLRDGTVVVHTPFDSELAELSTAINETYLPLGELGRERTEKLKAQDDQAAKLDASVAASRAQVKASRLYSSGWDLVDALEEEKVALADIAEGDLPEPMREMSLNDRESYVEELQWRRKELRQRIAELSVKRREFVARQIQAKGLDDSRAFDTVIRQTLRDKLQEKGFQPPN